MNEGLLLNRAAGFSLLEGDWGKVVGGEERENQDWPSATRWSHLENVGVHKGGVRRRGKSCW